MNPEETHPSKISTPEESIIPQIEAEEPAFGWNSYTERINGRFAMLGFVGLLLLEFFTHQDLFTWLGLR